MESVTLEKCEKEGMADVNEVSDGEINQMMVMIDDTIGEVQKPVFKAKLEELKIFLNVMINMIIGLKDGFDSKSFMEYADKSDITWSEIRTMCEMRYMTNQQITICLKPLVTRRQIIFKFLEAVKQKKTEIEDNEKVVKVVVDVIKEQKTLMIPIIAQMVAIFNLIIAFINLFFIILLMIPLILSLGHYNENLMVSVSLFRLHFSKFIMRIVSPLTWPFVTSFSVKLIMWGEVKYNGVGCCMNLD
jgi:hypothetical protein